MLEWLVGKLGKGWEGLGRIPYMSGGEAPAPWRGSALATSAARVDKEKLSQNQGSLISQETKEFHNSVLSSSSFPALQACCPVSDPPRDRAGGGTTVRCRNGLIAHV
jgi:hypothetical protein